MPRGLHHSFSKFDKPTPNTRTLVREILAAGVKDLFAKGPSGTLRAVSLDLHPSLFASVDAQHHLVLISKRARLLRDILSLATATLLNAWIEGLLQLVFAPNLRERFTGLALDHLGRGLIRCLGGSGDWLGHHQVLGAIWGEDLVDLVGKHI